jgi:DNA-binding transcriptional LysR family regulator
VGGELGRRRWIMAPITFAGRTGVAVAELARGYANLTIDVASPMSVDLVADDLDVAVFAAWPAPPTRAITHAANRGI